MLGQCLHCRGVLLLGIHSCTDSRVCSLTCVELHPTVGLELIDRFLYGVGVKVLARAADARHPVTPLAQGFSALVSQDCSSHLKVTTTTNLLVDLLQELLHLIGVHTGEHAALCRVPANGSSQRGIGLAIQASLKCLHNAAVLGNALLIGLVEHSHTSLICSGSHLGTANPAQSIGHIVLSFLR